MAPAAVSASRWRGGVAGGLRPGLGDEAAVHVLAVRLPRRAVADVLVRLQPLVRCGRQLLLGLPGDLRRRDPRIESAAGQLVWLSIGAAPAAGCRLRLVAHRALVEPAVESQGHVLQRRVVARRRAIGRQQQRSREGDLIGSRVLAGGLHRLPGVLRPLVRLDSAGLQWLCDLGELHLPPWRGRWPRRVDHRLPAQGLALARARAAVRRRGRARADVFREAHRRVGPLRAPGDGPDRVRCRPPRPSAGE
mmetsp:Transcript_32722/g.93023  ORF Transcript_32722/g.93023 Transcript_32722/m.93023 type:complete len:249 (-) Transcript_32722:490-1236(-)